MWIGSRAVAVRVWSYEIDGMRVDAGSPERGATIAVEPLPPRGFGPVQIPRSRVALTFRGLTPAKERPFSASSTAPSSAAAAEPASGRAMLER